MGRSQRQSDEQALAIPREGRLSPLMPSDELVRHCVAMVANRTWITGHSHYVVAKQFDCTPAKAYGAYREALRFIRDCSAAIGLNRTQILIRAREIADQDDPDRLPALTLIAKMTGTLDPPKEELRTSEERVAYLRECLREPDDELLTALIAEKEVVMKHLMVEVEAEGHEVKE